MDHCIRNFVLYIEKKIFISSSQRTTILLKPIRSPAGISILKWQVKYIYVISLGLDCINITILLHYACSESMQAYSPHYNCDYQLSSSFSLEIHAGMYRYM